MKCCFIGLGSNLNDPLAQVTRAIESLSKLPSSTLISHSAWYRSSPVGPEGQDDYINGVAQLQTSLSPAQLLTALQAIENQQQRVRREHWGPRTLDLDILLIDQQTIDTPSLTVPHKEIFNRNFVLQPLADIAPTLVFPDGSSLTSRLNSCPANELERLAQ